MLSENPDQRGEKKYVLNDSINLKNLENAN